MANKDWPSGLLAVESLTGETPRSIRLPLRQAVQTTKYATAIYKGQCVSMLFNSTAAKAWAVGNAVTNPGESNWGVAGEFYGGSARHGTKTDIMVNPAKGNVFAIQADNTTTTSDGRTKIGYVAALLNPTAGSTITGISTSELDWSSLATTGDKALRIVGMQKTIGEGVGINQKFLVQFNFGHSIEQVTDVSML